VDRAQAAAILQAPGQPFELAREVVHGREVNVFKHRERSMRDKVARAAVHESKEFLVYGEQRITFSAFVELCWGVAHTLLEQFAVRPQDRIAILAQNRPEWLIALFGAASADACVVGLNGWWSPEEMSFALQDSGARFLIVDDALYPRVRGWLSERPRTRETGNRNALETVFFIGDDPPPGTVPISQLLKRSAAAPTVPIAEDDPFVILYTSGTTGRSKGCITTHRGTIAQVQGITYLRALASLLEAEHTPGAPAASVLPLPTTLLTSPLFHVAGQHSTVCAALTAGSKLVFGPPRFEPEHTLDIIERERVTSWVAIPTLLQRLLDSPALHRYDLSSLVAISTGGAATAPDTVDHANRVLKTRPRLATSYGLTETHGMATSIAGADYLTHKRSVGRPTPLVEVRIVDELGRDRPQGVPGQILIGGPTVTPGYWGRPQETAETVRDGWLYTGDIGYFDADGFLYISDRQKDMVIRGGENVYCVEVENCLASHPEIVEAAVVGMPDRDMGERLKAIVHLVPGSKLSAADVQAHVAEHLANFKVPSEVEFMDRPLPRNAAGKVLKNLLRRTGTLSFPPEAFL
jgi:long-chain acyl-CoA synthetase